MTRVNHANALPVIPFTFGNKRIQRSQNLSLTEEKSCFSCRSINLAFVGERPCQSFTSKRRIADQGPELPPLFARARNHILTVGNVLVLNWDAVVV
jgi:hypothetical protein